MTRHLLAVLAVLCCCQGILSIHIISKSEWGGRPSKAKTAASTDLQYAIIHHSAQTYCSTKAKCMAQMRSIQNYHMDSQGWNDIGYNFAVGADGNIYEGRGFGLVGAHAYGWNTQSIGIVFIGNYNNDKLRDIQVTRTKELLNYAVANGYLSPKYILYGHRQVGSTECPGKNLFAEIKKWPHWIAN